MNLLPYITLLQLAAILALGEPTRQSKPTGLHNDPEALVRSLYDEVVARHPIGIPGDAEMKTLAPYLSEALHRRIDVALACATDWDRRNPDPNLKPPFAWLEFGLFSGDDWQASPNSFRIERTQSEKDGSFRAYVKLTWDNPPERPENWHVAAIVVRENGHLVVNDVIYLKDESQQADSRLSEILSAGCDGSRWVGYGSHRSEPKQR